MNEKKAGFNHVKILRYPIASGGLLILTGNFLTPTRSTFLKRHWTIISFSSSNVDSQGGIITRSCADVDLLNVRDESAEGGYDSSILLAPM